MVQEQKVKYLTIALNICKFGFTESQVDLMVRIYDLVLEKEGNTDLESIVEAKAENEQLYCLQTGQV